MVGIYAGFDPFPNEPAVQRVTVLENSDRAEPSHLALYLGMVIMPFSRQLTQDGQFLFKPLSTTAVELVEELGQELLILITTDKILAAPEHKSLIYRLLEPVMTFFNITVLIRTAGLYLVAFKAIVFCQAPVVVGKDLRVADLVDGTKYLRVNFS